MMKNVLCKTVVGVIGLSGLISVSSFSYAFDESINNAREALQGYGVYFTENSVDYRGVSIYEQIVPKTTGKVINGQVEHGTYNYEGVRLYSQDPRYAFVNGVPFLEYVSESHDTSDEDPMFSMNSEIVLCWFVNERTMIQVEESRIQKAISDHGLSFKNRCVDNDSIRDYWRDVSRDIEIR